MAAALGRQHEEHAVMKNLPSFAVKHCQLSGGWPVKRGKHSGFSVVVLFFFPAPLESYIRKGIEK